MIRPGLTSDLAGLICAVPVFQRKPLETRILQDRCAGAIYIGGGVGAAGPAAPSPAVYKGHHDPRVLVRAFAALHDLGRAA